MTTNDEINAVFIRSYTGENWIHKEGFLNPTLKSWIDTMLNQARADEREKAIVKAAEKAGKHAFTPKTTDEIIELIKQSDSQITMTTKTLQEMLKDEGNKAKADTLRFAIAHMRVGRSGMCLKDRAILLNEINLLETDLKKIEG